MGTVSLRAAVAELRDQIGAAQRDGASSNIAMTITEAVVEISGAFTETKDAEGQVKAKFSVFGIGAEAGGGGGLTHETASAQKITLKLTVQNRETGKPQQVNKSDTQEP